MSTEAYCGCCGDGPLPDEDWWCANCIGHVSHGGEPWWERSYLARTGLRCPYEV